MLTTRKHLVQVGNKTTFPPSLDIAFKDISLFFFFCEEPDNKHFGLCGILLQFFLSATCNTAEDVGNKRMRLGSNKTLPKD